MNRFASALVLALACSAVFGSAAASAATTVDLNCGSKQPTAGAPVTCSTILSSAEGAPRGVVRFERLGFADFDQGRCRPFPVTETKSFCSFQFKVTAPGTLRILASHEDPITGALTSEILDTLVAPGGSIRVECSPEFGTGGQPSTCETFVPNAPGVAGAPSGKVQFRLGLQFVALPGTAGSIDPECSLEAVPGGARCAVRIVPQVSTSIAIIADYEGDGSHPVQFGSAVYEVPGFTQTKTGLSCDPAPSTSAPITCTATVANLHLSLPPGAPRGIVEFVAEQDRGSFPDGATCVLKPVDEGLKTSESSCQVRYQPTRVGRQFFRAEYEADLPFESSGASLELEVVGRTATDLICLAQTGSAAGICLATVVDTSANPLAPTGTVKLNVPAGVKLNRETCPLSPSSTKGDSACAFSFRMDAVGSAPVVAEYSGSDQGHLPSSRNGTVSRRS
jgi:hypothetical protein